MAATAKANNFAPSLVQKGERDLAGLEWFFDFGFYDFVVQ